MMGLIYADITLANAVDVGLAQTGRAPKDSVRKIDVKALVDSGAYILTIDESIKTQLGLTVQETREIELADGSRSECEIVGPVDLYFKNRATTCRALVLPGATEVLLGAIPLEDLDVLIDPKSQQLIVNPARPYLAGTKVKKVQRRKDSELCIFAGTIHPYITTHRFSSKSTCYPYKKPCAN